MQRADGAVATWDRARLRRAIVLVVGLKVAGLILIFDPGGALEPFDLAKTVFSRATEWLLLALLLLSLARYGIGIFPRTRLHLGVIAYLGANALAAVFAEDPYVAAYGTQERLLGLAFLVDMAVLYCAVAVSFRAVADWLILGAGFLLGLLGSYLYAIVQVLGLDPLLWTDDPRSRPFSTLANPDMFGHFLGVSFGVCLGVIAVARRFILLIPAGLLAVLIFGLSLIVATRSTPLGMAGGLAGAFFAYVVTRGVGARTLARATLALIVVLAVAASVAIGSPLGQRVRDTLAGVGLQERLLVWENAINAFVDRPILGWGPDNIGVAYPRYRSTQSASIAGPGHRNNSAHSWLLQALVTSGLAGTSALVATLIAGLWLLATRGLVVNPLVGAPLLVGSVAFWSQGIVSVDMVGIDWIPWVAWGGAAALAAGQATIAARRTIARPVFVGAVALTLVAGSLGVNSLLASRAARAARSATDKGLTAPGPAEEAIARDPGRSGYWNEFGRARFAAGDLPSAETAFAIAAQRGPYEAVYWSNLGRTRAVSARTDSQFVGAALEAAHRGVAVDPNDPTPHMALADIALAVGQNREALIAAVDAIRLYQLDPRSDQLAVRAALGMPDLAEARKLLQLALEAKDSVALRIGMAQIALALRDLPEVRAQAQRALQLDPNNVEARRLLQASGG